MPQRVEPVHLHTTVSQKREDGAVQCKQCINQHRRRAAVSVSKLFLLWSKHVASKHTFVYTITVSLMLN